MRKRIGICDSDERYLRLMQEYLGKRKLTDFDVQTFISVEETLAYSKQASLEILLIGEECFQEAVKEMDVRKVYILQESSSCEITGFTKIMKYQSMERLICTVLEDYARTAQPAECSYEKDLVVARRAKITCFYTPLQSHSQTLYALAAAQLLAQEGKKVLYLNLTPFAGFETLLHTTYETDVTDFFYYALKHSDRLGAKLDGIKQRLGNVDYLPPAMDYQDLLSLSAAEWLDGLQQLQGLGAYDELVIEVSSASQGLYGLMQSCNRLYIVRQQGMAEQAAYLQFQELLTKRKQQAVLDKITFITDVQDIPDKIYYDTLVTSIYGVQMRKMLSNVGTKNENGQGSNKYEYVEERFW